MAKTNILRSEVEDKYKWDLECLYKDIDSFYKDLEVLKKLINEIEKYKGVITKDSKTLLAFLKLENEIDDLLDNLYVYASCNYEVDLSNSTYKKLQSDVLSVYSVYGEKTSFIMPELMKTPYKKIKEYINNEEGLKRYAFDLEEIYKYQPYTLTDEEEKLVSYIGDLQNKFDNNFDITLNSVIDFGTIKDEENNDVKLTLNNYSKFAKSKNRRVRKDAFESRGKALEKYNSLLATDYEGLLKSDYMIAKAKKYNSTIHMHLFGDGVDEKLYNTLLDVAKKNIDKLHKFFKMKKDILGYDAIYPYDLGAPLIEESNKKYSVEEAKELILKALSPLGIEYNKNLKEAFDNKWIDYIPNNGKKVGFYEVEAKKGHPFVLANYNEDFESVSALAHELGHAIHSHYSLNNQPSNLANYPILVAEVISLTNEMIFSDYIVRTSNDKNEKLNAIEHILNTFANNFYGTVSEGAVFEKIVHEKVGNNEALTEIEFNDVFDKILDEYFGNEVEKSNYSKYNWSRVPHFYTPFYYYRYAVGICGACYVSKKILDGDKDYLDKYYKFLKLGGSKTSLDLLKELDIDLTNIDVIEEGIKYFDSLIDKFISLYNS